MDNNPILSLFPLSAQGDLVQVRNLFESHDLINIEERGELAATPLIVATSNGHADVVAFLLQHGADKNAVNERDQTPLMLAAANGHVEIIDLLVAAGAKTEASDSVGTTALMYAATWGQREAVQRLLNLGADLYAETNDGETALTHALEKRKYDVADLLSGEMQLPRKLNALSPDDPQA